MNKIVSIKINAVFLAFVLVAGTIATISPFMGVAEAQSEYDGMDNRYNSYEPEPREYSPQDTEKKYNSYEPTYEIDSYEKPSYRNDYYEQPEYTSYKPDYKPSYGTDNNSYKSKKDSSTVNINKLNCINNNVNINGNNTGDINVGNSGSSAATNSVNGEGYLDIGSLGGNGEKYNGYKKSESFNCIINNNNINNNFGTGNATDGNQTEPLTCEECFRQFLNGTEISGFLLIIERGLFATLDQVCLNLDVGSISEEEVVSALEQVLGTGEEDRINTLIECLLEAGIEFEPEEGNGFNAQGEGGLSTLNGLPSGPGATFNLP